MNSDIIAMILSEGGKLITGIIRSRPPKPTAREPIQFEAEPVKSEIAIEPSENVKTGCLPCAVGHLSTCSGLLNEAMRFARDEGVKSSEVVDRINMCLDELNTMERVDLRPEKIANLVKWEKDLATQALDNSRATRHQLESITSVDDLEQIAASTQTTRREIGRSFFKEKLERMPQEEKQAITERAIKQLQANLEGKDGG